MQAQAIINKFGGAYELAEAIGVRAPTCYRWTYNKARGGTGGRIPRNKIPLVIKAAQQRGINIDSEIKEAKEYHSSF